MVFSAVYEAFSLGPLYPTYSLGSTSETAYWYVFMISISLLAFNELWYRYDRLPQGAVQSMEKILNLTPLQSIVVLSVFLLTYFAALRFRTLGVGLELNYVLPYRLNGVIEVTSLFLLPFFMALLSQGSRKRYFLFTCLILLYALSNLVSFGSKYAAAYPIVVYAAVHAMTSGKTFRRTLPLLAALLSLYTLLNPYYFRAALSNDLNLGPVETITESFRQATDSSVATPLLLGLRNVSVRVTGLHAMDWAIKITEALPGPQRDPVRFLNEFFNSGESNLAAGHFGYFMFATGSHPIGLLMAIVVLGLYFAPILWLDHKAMKPNGGTRHLLLGLVLILNLMPFLVDGRYEITSYYFQLAFSLIVAIFLLSQTPRMRSQTQHLRFLVRH